MLSKMTLLQDLLAPCRFLMSDQNYQEMRLLHSHPRQMVFPSVVVLDSSLNVRHLPLVSDTRESSSLNPKHAIFLDVECNGPIVFFASSEQ